jgi:hypothetical protein
MTPAGLGYQYARRARDSGIRYGIDMRPAALAPKPQKKGGDGAKRSGALPAIAAVSVVFLLLGLGMVVFITLEMSVKHEINQTVRATGEISAEIENLEVKIRSGAGLDLIERRAVEELGMIYPSADQLVYLNDEPAEVRDFAQYVKENAYQLW